MDVKAKIKQSNKLSLYRIWYKRFFELYKTKEPSEDWHRECVLKTALLYNEKLNYVNKCLDYPLDTM